MLKEQLSNSGHFFDNRIYTVRHTRVMLDSDLAKLYEVETSSLNRAVRRNAARFPEEFAFQLQQDEWDALKCQIGISNPSRGGRRYLPWVFTEHGAVMLATVLNSTKAVAASIQVVQAFVRLRRILDVNRALARKIDELADKVDKHDRAFAVVFHELQQLAAGAATEPESEQPKRRIGFRTSKDNREGKTRTAEKKAVK